MLFQCPKCQFVCDDIECSTLCPHDLLLPRELLEQKKLAISLLGHTVRFAHQRPGGETYRIQRVTWEGMVALDKLPGEFAPHVFIVEEQKGGNRD